MIVIRSKNFNKILLRFKKNNHNKFDSIYLRFNPPNNDLYKKTNILQILMLSLVWVPVNKRMNPPQHYKKQLKLKS
jgi:hypothetical protein